MWDGFQPPHKSKLNAFEVPMIESEFEYKQYLRNVRKLVEGTCYSYPTYLAAIVNHLKIDISATTITDINAVTDILDKLKQTKIDKNYWGNCQSALRAYLYFLQHKGSDSITFPDEEINFIEGSCVEVKVNRYERDLTARAECIKIHQAICKVCDFNFYEKYGDIGKGFIHVHHIIPISQIGSSYKINPKNDLIPVCPNCHAMLHTRNPPYSVQELRQKINENKHLTKT